MKISLYKVYGPRELRANLKAILDEAMNSKVIIRSRGRSFVLEAYSPSVVEGPGKDIEPLPKSKTAMIGRFVGNVSL